MKQSEHKFTNSLIHESSPYLLQHAHNPVNWYPWGDEAFEKAKAENKLVLVSIGYSACHWCHVMEHESFEDVETAEIMNRDFICIKVDREERPDVDQIYMNAVQLMTGRGGWPLNCFTLPDGRPVFGGTYYPKKQWQEILQELDRSYKTQPQKFIEYAEKLHDGIKGMDLIEVAKGDIHFERSTLDEYYSEFEKTFDKVEGGFSRAPKFPLPNNWEFILEYYRNTKNKSAWAQTELTLEKMALGGIYDQIGGGFARYSTDGLWKAPHFEKMLYDNAQLISLYSAAYALNPNPLYKEIVYQTLDFIEREMTSTEGAFYSALDADSEGEEGKFYVWTKEEFESVLGEDAKLMGEYFSINKHGAWEGNYILLRIENDQDFISRNKITDQSFSEIKKRSINKLFENRKNRIRPGLDDKQLCSWNALMAKAYADAYIVFTEDRFLKSAIRNADFILSKMRSKDGGLLHSYKEGKAKINAYLEDYSFTIEMLLKLYEATYDDRWISKAEELAEYTIKHFYDSNSGTFYFTSDLDPALITRSREMHDNVIPASNSSMSKGLFLLGLITGKEQYSTISDKLLFSVKHKMKLYPSGYSNYAMLMLNQVYEFNEIVIAGKNAKSIAQELRQKAKGNYFILASEKESTIPLFENRFVDGKTMIYVCEKGSCKLPVQEVSEAMKLLR